jgi:hypothetical protein
MISAAAVWVTPTRTRTLSPRAAAGRLLGVGGDRLDLAECPPGPAADRLARRGQAYRGAAARAVEQRLPQGRLQRGDLVRQRGLGEPERSRRAAERTQFGDGQDGLELAQAETVFDRLYRSYLGHSLTLS